MAEGARSAVSSFPWLKVLAAVGVAVYLLACGLGMAHMRDPVSGMNVLVPIAIALLPICVFLTFKYPLIFPFGLYVLITPVDALLSASGVASLVKLIGLMAAGALLLRTLLLRRALVPHQSWYYWAVLVAYAAASLAWTPDFDTGANTLVPILLLFVMMTVLALYPTSPFEFKIMMAVTILSGVGTSIYSIFQFHAAPQVHIAGQVSRVALKGISSTNYQDPNYLGGSFLLAIALALAGVFYARNIAVRLASALSILPMVAAVLTTGSRSAFFGVIAIFGYFIVRSKYRLQALLVGACGLALTAFYPAVLARLTSSDFGTADGRTDIWRTGMHSFADHWLFGAGIGSYEYSYDRNLLEVFQREFAGWSRPGHSLVFVALNDFGTIGFVLVVLCWYIGFRQLRVIPKTNWLYGIRIGLEAGMLGLFLHMLFLDPFFIKYVWLAQSFPLIVLNLYSPRVFRVGVPISKLRPARFVRGT